MSEKNLTPPTDFAQFISASPSSYHAREEVARRLDQVGFTRVSADQAFPTDAGGYYLTRDGAIIAWYIPAGAGAHSAFRIIGSHTDSPSFKLKPNPDYHANGWHQIGMEVYGGPLLNSWLNRDLGLAGRLVDRDGREHLVSTGPVAVIAQLAPHLDRSVNDKLELNRQRHLLPIFTLSHGDQDYSVLDYLCEQAGIARDDLGGYDIFATDTHKPRTFGPHEEFFAAWRMDNLSSVYASTQAMVDLVGANSEALGAGRDICILAAFDHEEVGSSTAAGACGPLLHDVLARLGIVLGANGDAYYQVLARSSCISADAGHAVHPNYADKHDPANHPLLNGGPLLKINANQRYATDAPGVSLWYRMCDEAGVPTQEFVSNNAVPCGSTTGPLTATRLGIRTVDVGIALLSMHSAREICGNDDMEYFARALRQYWVSDKA